METSFANSIKLLLDKTNTLHPIPTDVEEITPPLEGIRAVVFDIYGTLLISASGDIDQAGLSIHNISAALHQSGYQIIAQNSGDALSELLDQFTRTVKKHQDIRRNESTPFPEIDIRKVWYEVIRFAVHEKIINETVASNFEYFVFVFETLSNRVYPMPGFLSIIEHFHAQSIPLGIVSNAQFYTPYIMNHFLGNDLREDRIPPFDADISVFSYRLGKGKPDNYLYRQLIPAFEKKYNLKPQEVLYVGNDMLKDVYAAQQSGFKTVLFAGDKRSLRMREEQVKATQPDAIVTHLINLKNIVL